MAKVTGLRKSISLAVLLSLCACPAIAAQPCNTALFYEFGRLSELLPVKGQSEVAQLNDVRRQTSELLKQCEIPESGLTRFGFGTLTPIDVAIVADDARLIKRLISAMPKDAHPSRSEEEFGATPLHFAATYGTTKTIILLINSGFDPNARDEFGNTPLMAAPGGVEVEAANVKTLVKHGATVNALANNGDSPLTAAIISDDVAAVRYLLKLGATIKPKQPGAYSAIEVAKKAGNTEILHLLNEYCARDLDEPSS